MIYPHTYRTEHSETKTSNATYGACAALKQSKKIPVQPDLLKIMQAVDSHRTHILDDLTEAIQIKSVSGNAKYKDDFQKMLQHTENWLIKLGLKYEPFNIGTYEIDGQKYRPEVILASLGKDAKKKTLCIYVHLDVKEPEDEKWQVDPWKVTVLGNNIYGCGVAQGKSVLLHWFHVIQFFQKTRVDLPVNLKFIIECMYHHNSLGLEDFLPLRKQDFFFNINSVVVCDSEWIGEKFPCLVYGTVGFIHFDLFVEKVPETIVDPRVDIVNIVKELVDDEEHILIPNYDEFVTPITPAEESMYAKIVEFDIEKVRLTLPAFKQKWDQVKLLMKCWRLPSIWIGELEECICEKKDVNIVKKHIIAKIVPRQSIEESKKMIVSHIHGAAKKLGIQNKVKCEVKSLTRYWHENVANPCYQAAKRATIQIYKEDPSMIREDRSRYVMTILERVLETNILLLPLAGHGSNAGMENENVSIRTFYESTKLLAAYLFQLAK